MSKLSIILALVALLLLPAGIAFAAQHGAGSGIGLISDYTDEESVVHANGAVTVTLNDVPIPAEGTAYEAWLINDKGNVKLSIGMMELDADDEGMGSGTLTYQSPDEDLIALYSKLVITAEPVPDDDPMPSDEVVFSAHVPRSAMKYVRELLSGEDMGLLGQLRAQTMIAVNDAQHAAAADDIGQIKMYAEALVNQIEGMDGDNYGDLDGDGATTDNGDGMGLLAHSANRQRALVAAAAAPETDTVVQNAGKVVAYGEMAEASMMEARDAALNVLGTDVHLLAKTYAANAASHVEAAMEGFITSDALSGESFIQPGVVHVYEAAQAMATYTIMHGTDGLPSEIGPSLETLSVGDRAVPGIVTGAMVAAFALIAAGGLLVALRRRGRAAS